MSPGIEPGLAAGQHRTNRGAEKRGDLDAGRGVWGVREMGTLSLVGKRKT